MYECHQIFHIVQFMPLVNNSLPMINRVVNSYLNAVLFIHEANFAGSVTVFSYFFGWLHNFYVFFGLIGCKLHNRCIEMQPNFPLWAWVSGQSCKVAFFSSE